MRAVIQQSFGGPEVLQVVEADRPTPLSGEVLVRVRASALNPVDATVRSGAYPLLGEPPFGVGWDISGVVEEAAPGARYKVGDEVFGMPFFPRAATGYAEYVAAPSRQVALKPASLDFAGVSVEPDHAALAAIAELVDAGAIRPHVEQVFPLEEAAKAHEVLGTGQVRGKLVLTV
ncbi:zinc-binding dehydrogenase [Nonomuraea indica]|uniref:zinc-binding dehydrogenase n=1 Tax=Nonomuraea indica TaxID=1581193 RepID=UPI000C7B9FA2|nr:zinc-binding dehydrogenase [Nonomuraea indica]